MKSYIHDLYLQLLDMRLAVQEDFLGCTSDDLAAIAFKQKINSKSLPTLYTDFMKVMGRKGGPLFFGTTEIYYKAHIYSNLKEEANKLLVENGLEPLSTDAFVFIFHNTYVFGFFRTVQPASDPFVYIYTEGDDTPILKGKFSEMLDAEINLVANVRHHERKTDSLGNE